MPPLIDLIPFRTRWAVDHDALVSRRNAPKAPHEEPKGRDENDDHDDQRSPAGHVPLAPPQPLNPPTLRPFDHGGGLALAPISTRGWHARLAHPGIRRRAVRRGRAP